uniref:Eukaryotic translation initiation factor 2D n=1 Tax=Neogobius melanostomus TaxID=47308 RepID=A0A8C6TTS7_9GOBI
MFRRKLKADISAAFPVLTADELFELVPNKEELNVVKVYAHKGDAVTLYVLNKTPLFFELDKHLYPTVYVLWRFPALLPAFTTWPPVLQKLTGGADLMLPGVVVPLTGLPHVNQGDCCAVKVSNNRAPVAVGTAALSSTEMQGSGMKGRGVCILHSYMDTLWSVLLYSTIIILFAKLYMAELNLPDHIQQDDEKTTDGDQRSPQELMDALLFQCFLHALKTKVKKSELPLLTSTFLRNHMFACCPNGKQLDIKKSSYKKLSKFLQTMQQQHSLIRVKELTKGVESLVEVDWKNPDPRAQILLPWISVFLMIYRKGAVLQPAEVRSIITDYVKKNELVAENNKNYVMINPTLCDCLLEKYEYHDVESMKWDDLFGRTMSKMQECYQIVFPGQEPMIKKGHLDPIDISVTLIKNLELYGFDPAVVSTALQHRVQASSVLQPLPGAKDRVLVQIQGNQIHQVGNLLLDHYKVPRKFIQGLEKAPKGGKKK